MLLDKRELSYLWDIQKAAKEISDFMNGIKSCAMLQNGCFLSLAKRQTIFLHSFVRSILNAVQIHGRQAQVLVR